MHISVTDILNEELGFSRAFAFTGERPELPEVVLVRDIEGEATITKLQSGVMARGWAETEIELECHRCLSTFHHPVRVTFEQSFKHEPEDDDLPIAEDQIDLAPLIEQEILVSLPIKLLCRIDCPGIPGSDEYHAEPDNVKHRARINERKNNART
jgi:uncharacterized metal-binding protein YceD (DUF177 family)